MQVQGVETGQQIKFSKAERRPGFDPARLFLEDLRVSRSRLLYVILRVRLPSIVGRLWRRRHVLLRLLRRGQDRWSLAPGVEDAKSVQSKGTVLFHTHTPSKHSTHLSPGARLTDRRAQSGKGGKKASDVILNEVTTLAEMERMGQGLIKTITVHQK